jgi:hypothetical protein
MTSRVSALVRQPALAALAAAVCAMTASAAVCAMTAPAAAADGPAAPSAAAGGLGPHGPGHYEETSGLRQSPGCNGTGATYSFSTPPIAPGHVITNFQFRLIGDNSCGQKQRWKKFNANCELVTDKPNRKTVVFELLTNRDQCFASETFGSGGGESHNSGNVTTRQHGAVTISQMVFSYDVQ